MLALLGGKAESGQKHPIIYSFDPLIKDFNLSELLISSILAVCFICSRVFLMEFNRFHQFGSWLLNDDFVLSYSGYVTEDILEAVGTTLRQRIPIYSKPAKAFFTRSRRSMMTSTTIQPSRPSQTRKSTSRLVTFAASISTHRK